MPLDRPARTRAGIRAGLAATFAAIIAAAAPVAAAYRFALVYRRRAGLPMLHPPRWTPADLGLPYSETVVPSGHLQLPAWFIPANGGTPGPGVVLVHGWESARDRTLPNAQVLHAAGFHILTFDVRGHGANPPEAVPITAGEYGLDAAAGLAALLARPEVTRAAILGHSMGAIGALLAGAADPRTAAVVSTAAPADPYRLTRQTFRLAGLPIPDPIAYPLAWLTARVYVRPRGHAVDEISAARAAERYRGPLLLVHGDKDDVIPLAHLRRLEEAARRGRAAGSGAGGAIGESGSVLGVHVVAGGRHSWLYEDEGYRRTVARFLASALGGPLDPSQAEERAAAVPARRLPDREPNFSAVEATRRGVPVTSAIARPTSGRGA